MGRDSDRGELAGGDGPQRMQAVAQRSLQLEDLALLLECREEFFRAGGPGGQHRNKTESAVRLFHLPTGVSVTASERRGQARNRAVALERLRKALRPLAQPARKRKPTRPPASSGRRRLEKKRRLAAKKGLRRKPPSDAG